MQPSRSRPKGFHYVQQKAWNLPAAQGTRMRRDPCAQLRLFRSTPLTRLISPRRMPPVSSHCCLSRVLLSVCLAGGFSLSDSHSATPCGFGRPADQVASFSLLGVGAAFRLTNRSVPQSSSGVHEGRKGRLQIRTVWGPDAGLREGGPFSLWAQSPARTGPCFSLPPLVCLGSASFRESFLLRELSLGGGRVLVSLLRLRIQPCLGHDVDPRSVPLDSRT